MSTPGTDVDVSGPVSAETAPVETGAGSSASPGRGRRRVPWAELLLRVFFTDVLSCPRCSIPMIVLAFLSDPPVVAKILRHLGLPATAPPLAPADPARGQETGYGPLFPGAARPPP